MVDTLDKEYEGFQRQTRQLQTRIKWFAPVAIKITQVEGEVRQTSLNFANESLAQGILMSVF